MAKKDVVVTDAPEVPAKEEVDIDSFIFENDSDVVELREQINLAKKEITIEKDEKEIEDREKFVEENFGVKPKPRSDEDFIVYDEEEIWDFGEDKDNWREDDIGEEWADAPPRSKRLFYDPDFASANGDDDDDEDEDMLRSRRKRKPKKEKSKAPVEHSTDRYVPYRRPYPPIPQGENWPNTPLDVLEELEMEEQFLDWASYVFRDGATYEGTVWNDVAQGRGVYITPHELCRYEGEWVQNMMQGHGVLSVDLPLRVGPPNSEEWLKLKSEGRISEDETRDSFDLNWIKMGIEDISTWEEASKKNKSIPSPVGVPFEDHPGWQEVYGRKPERGHYEYAGQMKHNRFHGCGVLTVNGKMTYGKWYFGDLLANREECDAQSSGFHAAMARVTAAKAKMFENKPDGMVREVKGPFNELSHPYLIDHEDMWQAPGFVNEFHPVPDVWSRFVEELDSERQIWLNSFLSSPLRVPGPAELSYLWDKEDEFVVLRNEPRMLGPPTEEDAIMAQPELQGEVLLHVPSNQLINWTEDNEGKLRFFIQPWNEDGKFDVSQVKPLPLGFEEFMQDKPLGKEEEEDEEDEDDAPLPEDPLKQRMVLERRLRRKQQRVKERRARKERAIEAELEAKRNAREREWARQDAEEEELKRLEEEQFKRELELIDEEFEARLDAMEELEEMKKGGGKRGTEEAVEADEKVDEAAKEKETPQGEEEPREEEQEEDEGDDEEEEDDDDDDDDDDDKKPRSFGTVASADILVEETRESTQGKGRRYPPSGTAFASISLATQGLMHQVSMHLASIMHSHSVRHGSMQPDVLVREQRPLNEGTVVTIQNASWLSSDAIRTRKGRVTTSQSRTQWHSVPTKSGVCSKSSRTQAVKPPMPSHALFSLAMPLS